MTRRNHIRRPRQGEKMFFDPQLHCQAFPGERQKDPGHLVLIAEDRAYVASTTKVRPGQLDLGALSHRGLANGGGNVRTKLKSAHFTVERSRSWPAPWHGTRGANTSGHLPKEMAAMGHAAPAAQSSGARPVVRRRPACRSGHARSRCCCERSRRCPAHSRSRDGRAACNVARPGSRPRSGLQLADVISRRSARHCIRAYLHVGEVRTGRRSRPCQMCSHCRLLP